LHTDKESGKEALGGNGCREGGKKVKIGILLSADLELSHYS